jgi:molecular chaperone DnaJ
MCQIPISFIQAALGDEITIPTLTGEKVIQIPKGIQPGETMRLEGEGIPSLRNGSRGSQMVQFSIKTPTNMSKKQEELLKQFAKIEQGKLTNKIKNILKGGSMKV